MPHCIHTYMPFSAISYVLSACDVSSGIASSPYEMIGRL
nr:MAG TPA: hypothetical protein [Caudoviricetes sp.]